MVWVPAQAQSVKTCVDKKRLYDVIKQKMWKWGEIHGKTEKDYERDSPKTRRGIFNGVKWPRGLYLCGYSGKHVIQLLQETQGVFGAKRAT